MPADITFISDIAKKAVFNRHAQDADLPGVVLKLRALALEAGQSPEAIKSCTRYLARLMAEHVAGIESRIYQPAQQALVEIGKTHKYLWNRELRTIVRESMIVPGEHACEIANIIEDQVVGGMTWKNAELYP